MKLPWPRNPLLVDLMAGSCRHGHEKLRGIGQRWLEHVGLVRRMRCRDRSEGGKTSLPTRQTRKLLGAGAHDLLDGPPTSSPSPSLLHTHTTHHTPHRTHHAHHTHHTHHTHTTHHTHHTHTHTPHRRLTQTRVAFAFLCYRDVSKPSGWPPC